MINGTPADQLEQLERLPRGYALGGGGGNGIPHGNGITQSQFGRISITVMPLVAARDEERFPMKRAWMVSVWMLPVSRENPSGIARRRDHEETCPGCRTMITTWIIFVLAELLLDDRSRTRGRTFGPMRDFAFVGIESVGNRHDT